MTFLYIGMLLLAAFPLLLTIWRMRSAANVKKNGIWTDAIVTHIRTIRMYRGGSVDMLTLEYKDRATGRAYYGKATVAIGRYRTGDRMQLAYLPARPSKYAIDTKGGFTFILVFCILLFAFVVFAIWKIDEMAKGSNF
jgi:hypothetical protein